MKLQVRGILFDMDGVLVSSLGSVERSWAKWGEMRGVDTVLAIQAAHGRRAIETLRHLRPDLNDVEELKLIEEIEIADKDDIEVLAGVERVLATLPQKYWTVVTSATEKLARARLGYAGLTVPEHFITADLVTNGKPNPEPYIKGAALLGQKPEDCLVIEDSTSGAIAGHAAGCKVLATLFSHSAENLSAADWIVQSLDDVAIRVLEDSVEIEFTPLVRNGHQP
ncbi:HAD-IA family hydrolase [Alloacidobacterium sp.]|uniref:HAD-IA family hydrolase n=1 Tax=Alloacidobacterium sp. TaxID=2951999 RepID=UPI002D2791B0|nr:HAD-IA family hydrolase [Alloacidobacterium sp.]HYK34911.1 HAD-IA family hydrolase [Alloacidobacterium sp.]